MDQYLLADAEEAYCHGGSRNQKVGCPLGSASTASHHDQAQLACSSQSGGCKQLKS